jgi:carboxyl-terminal processing protease
VPGSLAFARVGEQYSRFPLPADAIRPNFNDAFEDIPYLQRGLVRSLYSKERQYRLERFTKLLPGLKKLSAERLAKNNEYQVFLKKIKQLGDEVFIVSDDPQKERDFQLEEGWSVLMDMLTDRC